jgi:signal transduction histidine kinase
VREIALHLLDIAENSVAAQAKTVFIAVCEDLPADRLSASVKDNGKGMDAETLASVVDPFVTSRTTRKVGLGIPLLKAAAEACDGQLQIASQLGKGTTLEVEFRRSHIDRMPLGDLGSTILTLVVAYLQIHWLYFY